MARSKVELFEAIRRDERLSLQVFDINPRARRVYEKCGFVVEGRLRDALAWEGQRHDTLGMAVLRPDVRPGRSP